EVGQQPLGERLELLGDAEEERLLDGDRRQQGAPLLVELAAFQGTAVSAELPAQLLRAPRHELAQVDELAGREDDARDRLDEGGEPFELGRGERRAGHQRARGGAGAASGAEEATAVTARRSCGRRP